MLIRLYREFHSYCFQYGKQRFQCRAALGGECAIQRLGFCRNCSKAAIRFGNGAQRKQSCRAVI
jgi:hypothetical protein